MAGEQRRARMAIGGNGARIGNQHGFKQPLAFVCYQLVLSEIIVKDFPILISLMFGFQKLRNYLLEYHLSFYHVTSSTATNMDSGYGDERAVRKMSPFTAGPKAKGRYIYEEQLSFITIGHGADVYTNIQLAEKYSCDPGDDTYDMPFYIRPECDSSSAQGPRHEDSGARPKGIAFCWKIGRARCQPWQGVIDRVIATG